MAKRILKRNLTGRMQFNLWFLLLGLLLIPFIPFRPIAFFQFFSRLGVLRYASFPSAYPMKGTAANLHILDTTAQMDDFALSVSSEMPSLVGVLLCGIWLAGMMAMFTLVLKSIFRLNMIRKSALPLQSKAVRTLYNGCLKETKIKRNIPVYSTVFLKSPIIVGLFHPRIYLPIHLISDFNATDMRYILLHELQHYRHRDALSGFFMNLIGILYWCNPLVWYALKEMRDDREIACDTSVLKLLHENDYEDYGNSLINFAEKISLTPFPFAAGISGSMKQMKRRITNISSYQKPSVFRRLKGFAAFAIIGVLFSGFVPLLSAHAVEQSRYHWNISSDKISTVDLSSYFSGYEGCFVLYDLKNDAWNIYNPKRAILRTSPDSTYKIYDALFGLEEGMITPDDSFMAWDKTDYPFEAWNKDQDLFSAMRSSVNWYFQEIDSQIGPSAIQNYVRKIGYGNRDTNSNRSPYWMQSSLKISPVEQVELLTALHNNSFDFAPENVNVVKDSIRLFSSEKIFSDNFSEETISFYGKTGTGRVDGLDVNGWFIGYFETGGNTYFFATNIQNDSDATGSKAAEITKAVLSDLPFFAVNHSEG